MSVLSDYTETLKNLKSTILSSRYRAAVLVNQELLGLYFSIGQLISGKIKQEKWGTKVLERLSEDLQHELPGLKGFSATNIKRMKQFFEVWKDYFDINNQDLILLQNTYNKAFTISPSVTDQFKSTFLQVSFTHHYEILVKTTTFEERFFYINKTTQNFWSVETLKHHLKANLFQKEGKLPNNFAQIMTNNDLRAKALQSFKDEYLLDFINIEDPDEEDEKLIENEIVRNIKKFLLSLGADFAFLGNQFRLLVEEDEYFIDLLFFNRKLQCLVAFELKKGKFKPEYMGKMNFYLSALDEYIKQPHENPSIGIILCKEKNNKTVEFSFRDFNKSMGVATYKTANEVPEQYKNALPNAETLKKLME
ncbi:MAG: PDDEXK nuclease domain-containing protein [Emticicia sp.]|nr:PDDEXK nuclease domain-containing protein [Emticicia sp.]